MTNSGDHREDETSNQPASLAGFVCPITGDPLRPLAIEDYSAASARLPVRARDRRLLAELFPDLGTVLTNGGFTSAYPVVNGIPILLAPENLGPAELLPEFDLTDPLYAEAYEEMAHYQSVSNDLLENLERSPSFRSLSQLTTSSPGPFDQLGNEWLDAKYDVMAQLDVYRHLGDPTGAAVLQHGGSGIHVVRLLLAGAATGVLVTPVLGEAEYARAMARELGVGDQLRCVVGTGEQIPLPAASMSMVVSGGCLHHMVTDAAFADAARVLESGGKFAAFDPFKAPLYDLGIKIFGKRETSVFCRPLDDARVASLGDAFAESSVVLHGTLTRYPLVALSKLGFELSLTSTRRIFRYDDDIADRLRLRRFGSSVAVLGTAP